MTVTGDVLLKEVFDLTAQPTERGAGEMEVGRVAVTEEWLRLCQTFVTPLCSMLIMKYKILPDFIKHIQHRGTHTLFLQDWVQTIFDVVPCRHQFGFQFVHLIRLPRRLSAGIWCLWQPEAKAGLPLQGLLPSVLSHLILHHPPYVLRCTGGNGVHPAEASELDSAAPHCNTELMGERGASKRWGQLLIFFTLNTFYTVRNSLTYHVTLITHSILCLYFLTECLQMFLFLHITIWLFVLLFVWHILSVSLQEAGSSSVTLPEVSPFFSLLKAFCGVIPYLNEDPTWHDWLWSSGFKLRIRWYGATLFITPNLMQTTFNSKTYKVDSVHCMTTFLFAPVH